MNRVRLFGLVCILAISALLVRPALAQDGTSPWSEFLNSDGSIRWDQLVDMGTVSEPADWMDVTLPGGLVVDLDATYHRYQTPSGNVLVLPSPTTLFFMAMYPQESGLTGADSMLGDGVAILSLLAGPALTADRLAELASRGYTDPKEFFQAIIDGRENIWSIVDVSFIYEVLMMSQDSGFWVNALLLYLNGAANCAEIPGGCVGIPSSCPGGKCPGPETSVCPAPSIRQEQPDLTIRKLAPEDPLVVGQDPSRRGADIEVSVRIPPVIFTWYEELVEPSTCSYTSSGNGSGCPGPGDRYGAVYDAEGTSISWSSAMEGSSSWQSDAGAVTCIEHIEVLPEPIVQVQASAQLSAVSRYWILNDLAGKYYEAYIHNPNFNLLPGLGVAQTGCAAEKVCFADAVIPAVPFADPGTFNLSLWVHTAGTLLNWQGVSIPLTPPRTLHGEGAFGVFVTLVSLIPAGAP